MRACYTCGLADRAYGSPYCGPCHNARTRAWKKSNAPRLSVLHRKERLKRLYGMSVEEFEEMLEAQEGKCAVCRAPEPGGRGQWHVDHCHSTGKIRGLLCHPCNISFTAHLETHLGAFVKYANMEEF